MDKYWRVKIMDVFTPSPALALLLDLLLPDAVGKLVLAGSTI